MLRKILMVMAMLTSSAFANQPFDNRGRNGQSTTPSYNRKDRNELNLNINGTTQTFDLRSDGGEEVYGYAQEGEAPYYFQQTYETGSKLFETPGGLGGDSTRIRNGGNYRRMAFVAWSNQRQYNLMFAAFAQRKVHYCIKPIRFSGGQLVVSRMVEQGFQEWFAPLNVKITATQIAAGCRPDIAGGVVAVELYGDENEFVYRTGGGPANTLGIYFPSLGTLMLNMTGILNPNRDNTGGYKTILHELGHVFGLDHSPKMNSIMYYNLRYASSHLSVSDIAEVRAIARFVQND